MSRRRGVERARAQLRSSRRSSRSPVRPPHPSTRSSSRRLAQVVGLRVSRRTDRRRRRPDHGVVDRRGAGLPVAARRGHRVGVPDGHVSSAPGLVPPFESTHALTPAARDVRAGEARRERLAEVVGLPPAGEPIVADGGPAPCNDRRRRGLPVDARRGHGVGEGPARRRVERPRAGGSRSNPDTARDPRTACSIEHEKLVGTTGPVVGLPVGRRADRRRRRPQRPCRSSSSRSARRCSSRSPYR